MGTLTSYVGAIFVGRPPDKGSTGFCWINITVFEASTGRDSLPGPDELSNTVTSISDLSLVTIFNGNYNGSCVGHTVRSNGFGRAI